MKGSSTWNQFIKELIPALFVFLFCYTAVSKLLNLAVFESTLERSPIIGSHGRLVAWTIPIIELTISVFLLVAGTRLKALYFSLGLMLLFTGYIFFMLVFVADMPCSCGGIIQNMSWRQHIVFNIICMAIAWKGIRLMRRTSKSTPIHTATAN